MSSQGKRAGWLPFMIVTVFVVGMLSGKLLESKGLAQQVETYEELQPFTEVLNQVQRNYVEETKTKDVIYGAIRGLLKTLDPHSAFMTPELYKEMQVDTRGEFGGLGIQIGVKEERLTVIAPIEDTPAERAGIKAGDQILKIDGVTTKDLSLMDAVNKMRGPKGTKVELTLSREGEKEPLNVSLVRDIIKIQSVGERAVHPGRVGGSGPPRAIPKRRLSVLSARNDFAQDLRNCALRCSKRDPQSIYNVPLGGL